MVGDCVGDLVGFNVGEAVTIVTSPHAGSAEPGPLQYVAITRPHAIVYMSGIHVLSKQGDEAPSKNGQGVYVGELVGLNVGLNVGGGVGIFTYGLHSLVDET